STFQKENCTSCDQCNDDNAADDQWELGGSARCPSVGFVAAGLSDSIFHTSSSLTSLFFELFINLRRFVFGCVHIRHSYSRLLNHKKVRLWKKGQKNLKNHSYKFGPHLC